MMFPNSMASEWLSLFISSSWGLSRPYSGGQKQSLLNNRSLRRDYCYCRPDLGNAHSAHDHAQGSKVAPVKSKIFGAKSIAFDAIVKPQLISLQERLDP